MGVVKRNINVLDFSEELPNITHHSYTYNKKYNAFWRGLALQLRPFLNYKTEKGNKELKGGYKIK